jgi:hypothetical protein
MVLGTGLGDTWGFPRGISGTMKATFEQEPNRLSSRETWDGKEGVIGSSPIEGFTKVAA